MEIKAKITVAMKANGPKSTVPPTAKPEVVKKAIRKKENDTNSAISP